MVDIVHTSGRCPLRPGILTTSEHPDLLAAAIRDIAERHGVGTLATANR